MKRVLLSASASAAALVGVASAQIGVDLSAGTPGISGNIHYRVMPMLVLRGGVNYLEFELEDQEFDDIAYDADLQFTQVGGYVDVHPFSNFFTITGGLLVGERTFELSASPTEPVEIGDTTFAPEDVGELFGNADFGDQGIYAGIGFDNTVTGRGPVTFVLRAGVIIGDDPTVDLGNRNGTLDPILQAEIDAELTEEEAQLQEDIPNLFPVLTIGLGFKF